MCTGFANPPGIVNCSVKEVASLGQAKFTIYWTPPVLTGVGNLQYTVRYLQENNNGFYNVFTHGDSVRQNSANFTISVDKVQKVEIIVHLTRPVIGPEAICVIDPDLRCEQSGFVIICLLLPVFLSVLNNQPLPLTLNFEHGNVTVEWSYTPLQNIPSPRDIRVTGSCVHGKDVFKVTFVYCTNFSLSFYFCSTMVFSLVVETHIELMPSLVCQMAQCAILMAPTE